MQHAGEKDIICNKDVLKAKWVQGMGEFVVVDDS